MKIWQKIIRFWCLFGALLWLAGFVPPGSAVYACSINSEWTKIGGASTAGEPRYTDECAFHASVTGSAQYLSHDMDDVTAYVVSFYALTRFTSGSSNDVTIFQALFDGNVELELTISADQTANLWVSTSGGGTTLSRPIPTSAENYRYWNHYKISFDASGNVEFCTNGDQNCPSSTGAHNITALDEQRIGYVEDTDPTLSDKLAFDEFVSLITDDPSLTNPKCPGDTNDSGALTTFDASVIFQEAVNSQALSSGQPDYNGSGSITTLDASTVFQMVIDNGGGPVSCTTP